MSDEWKQAEEWSRSGRGFSVIVRHWSVQYGAEPVKHCWNVYAVISSRHPLFESFTDDTMYQDAACALPLHAGPSYFERFHAQPPRLAAVKVGSDYRHYRDERFAECETRADAYEVFRDADELFDHLAERVTEVAA